MFNLCPLKQSTVGYNKILAHVSEIFEIRVLNKLDSKFMSSFTMKDNFDKPAQTWDEIKWCVLSFQ